MSERPSAPRALVVTPSFFGYERDIQEQLRRHGFDTVLMDERPSNSSFERAVLRVKPSLVHSRVKRHFEAMWKTLERQRFDIVLVIKAEVVPRWFIERLRGRNPAARFVFYTFDALDNAGNCRAILDCFDDRWSFDSADVSSESGRFHYLPLFYTDDFHPAPERADRPHWLSFVGTLHSNRYAIAKTAFGTRSDVYGFFYAQARWYFLMSKFITRDNRAVPWRDVSFSSLSKRQIAAIFRASRAVIDVQRTGQAGLTMRTFEVLASGAILVTTNPAIRDEPFFDERQIIVLNDADRIDSVALHRELLDRPDPAGAPPGFDRYSLASWVSHIVNGPEVTT